MAKSLRIIVDVVNTELAKLASYVDELDAIYRATDSEISAGWSSAKALEVSKTIEEVRGTIDEMKAALNRVKANVSQYQSNVTSIEESVTINKPTDGEN